MLAILSREKTLMSYKYFVTGTDTGIGKTYISVGLLNAINHLGYTTIGMKPLASGAFGINHHLYNQDALDLKEASSIQLDYQYINPFVFAAPVAPHLAAAKAGTSLSLQEIILKSQHALDYACDIHLVEGVGGWVIPFNDHETMIDFVSHYQMNVILVVGIRLGCINHAMLTYQAIKHAHLPIAGWVANCFDHYELQQIEPHDIIATLQNWLDIPYLGMVPYRQKPEHYLKITNLLPRFTS